MLNDLIVHSMSGVKMNSAESFGNTNAPADSAFNIPFSIGK
jgi:hypothetical protein